MSKFLKKLKKVSGNEYGFIASEEKNVYSYDKAYDTGSFMLNGLLCGDIYGGIIPGRRYMVAGPPSTGKSYLTSLMMKTYLEQKPKCMAIIFESEGSTIIEMTDSVAEVKSVYGEAQAAGISKERMLVLPVKTIEDARTQCMKMLAEIKEHNDNVKSKNKTTQDAIDKLEKSLKTAVKAKTPNKEKIQKLKDDIKTANGKFQDEEEFIFSIDSLGMLSTNKEVGDIVAGEDKRDMTRAQLLKGFARVSSLEFSLLKIPLLIVNHVYATMSQYSPDAVAGGSGPLYMCDVCLILSKGKEKDTKKKQVGVIIGVKVHKGRFTKENIGGHIIISFKHGLYPYSDLERFAKEHDVFEVSGKNYILPDGTEEKTTIVRSNFKNYANEINMNAINEAIKKEFKFGQADDISDEINIEDIEDVE